MLISGGFSMVLDLSEAQMKVYINKKLCYYCIQAVYSSILALSCFALRSSASPLHAAAKGEVEETLLLTFKEVVTPSK